MRDDKPLGASMQNEEAMTLGRIAAEAGGKRSDVGDPIDRGLILVRLLKEAGFDVYKVDRRYGR